MKKILFFAVLLIVQLGFGQTTYYSRVTGDFNTVGSWSTSPTGTPTNANALNNADNFVIQNGHNITVAAIRTINNLTINSGGILTVAGFNFIVSGSTSISGALTYSSATGTRRFVSLVTINTGGSWTNNISNSPVNFRGGLTNDGTFTSGTGIQTFDTNAQVISGNLTMSNVTVTSIILTNNGTLSASTALSGSGTLTNSSTGTLNIGGTSGITTLTATAPANIVNYNGAAQTVKATTYSNLTLSGSGGKTFGAAITVNNNLSIATNSIANLGTGLTHPAGTLTLGGITTPSGTWGSTSSLATNSNNTFFAATTGMVSVTTATCTTPTLYAMTGAGGAFCSTLAGSSVGLANSQVGVDYQLLRGSVAVGSPIPGTGTAIPFGTFNTTGAYTVLATRTGTLCTATMTGNVNILNYSTPPTPTATVVDVSCPTDATGTITITNPVAPASLAFVSASNQYIDFGTPLLSGRAAFTVEGWIKFDPVNYVTRMALFGQNDAIEIAFETNGTVKNLRCWTAGGGQVDLPLSSFPAGNAWHHIAVTGDGTANGLKIYLDGGAPALGGNLTGSYGSSTDSAKIGYGIMDPLGSGVGLTGEVFKLGFWNRALSAAEITNLSSGFVVYDASQSGLLAGYSFNEAIGGANTVSGVGSVAPTGTFVNTPVRKDPYTYSWASTPPGFTSSSKNLTALSPRTYNLITSLKGCTNTGSWVVNSTNTTPVITAQPSSSNQSYCINSSATALSLAATGTGLTYQWYSNSVASTVGATLISGATNNTYTPLTTTAGTLFYYCVVSATCTAPATSTLSGAIAIGTSPVAISGSTNCNGFTANWTAYAGATTYLLDVSTNNLFSSFVSNGLDVGNVTNHQVTGLINGTTYYYRLSAVLTCGTSAPSNTIVVLVSSLSTITWNGTGWVGGIAPTLSDNIRITSVLPNSPFTSNVSGCTLTIDSGVTARVSTGVTITITNAVTTNGQLIFENTASLIQTTKATNVGPIEYRRISSPMKNFDFTYWSSPVLGQTTVGLSPNTFPDKYFSFNGATEAWELDKGTMIPGKGYIIRVPKPGSPSPDNWSGTLYSQPVAFKGIPNNGNYSYDNVGPDQFHLIGNPYPSALDADLFITNTNNAGVLSGGLYFWTHNTPINNNIYGDNDYATYTLTGGVGTGVGTGVGSNPAPGRYIGAGQSFFIGTKTGIPTTSQFVFNNGMRVAGSNTQFFKQTNSKNDASFEKNRIWLNLTNSGGAFKQMLVGYITGATNNYDNLYDAPSFDGQTFVDFYSIANAENLTVQGRALPFENTDEVPLGYRSTIAGPFEIGIDNRDGKLATQEIWLEDKKTGAMHDLTKGKYNFTSIEGVENDRFVLKYTNKTLGTGENELAQKRVLIAVKDKKITISSTAEAITQIQIFDLLGRKLFEKSKLNTQEWSIPNLPSSEQTLIVKTTLQNGAVTSQKIIF